MKHPVPSRFLFRGDDQRSRIIKLMIVEEMRSGPILDMGDVNLDDPGVRFVFWSQGYFGKGRLRL